ncbi:hypothetical protein M3Y98_00709300 [Aphelenchoides besseyi]|nr:hypothetical protein M3Y98_00709300 [Aphelenchoides besseyi]KAI6210346.1 hypothetical protein M3Y96_00318600 [Aphelenchoides besseyi]
MRFWFVGFLGLMFVGVAMAGHHGGFEEESDPTERSSQLLDRKRAIYQSYSKKYRHLQKLHPEMFGEDYYKKKYNETPPLLPEFVPLKHPSKDAYKKDLRESPSVVSQFKESDFNGPQALKFADVLKAELLKRQFRKSFKQRNRKTIPNTGNVYDDV